MGLVRVLSILAVIDGICLSYVSRYRRNFTYSLVAVVGDTVVYVLIAPWMCLDVRVLILGAYDNLITRLGNLYYFQA